ncbi:MAG: helix-turn-helix domain-containing protein [Rubrivivax sp.]|nr:helix-turn-helix domain-containing protein [Rubrivivax sp.]
MYASPTRMEHATMLAPRGGTTAFAETGTAAGNDTRWASASLGELLPLLGLSEPVDERVAAMRFPVRRLHPDDVLYRAGDRFDAVYVLRSGFCKAVVVDEIGDELVQGFPMAGDVLGLDGVDEGHYGADVIARDMCSVAVIPFAQLTRLGREHPAIERLLFAVFSRELVRQRRRARLCASLGAEARLASFLLDLSERFGRLGHSRTMFTLRMTRAEIGSYLGMKLETVSRMFSQFVAAGLLGVERKAIVLHDTEALQAATTAPARGERAADSRRGTCSPARRLSS